MVLESRANGDASYQSREMLSRQRLMSLKVTCSKVSTKPERTAETIS